MLNAISDYTYTADAYADADISGRIIPAEDVAGMKNAVRLENIAFLSEGISERLKQRFVWQTLAYRPVLQKSTLASIGAKIREMFASKRYVDPNVSYWPNRTVSSSSTSVEDAYLTHALDEYACSIPESVPDNLSADYLRHCFYDLNLLRKGFHLFASFGGTLYTYGGSVVLSAVLVDSDSDGVYESKFSDIYYIAERSGSPFQPLGGISGTAYRFSGKWDHGRYLITLGNSYRLYWFCNIDVSYSNTNDTGYADIYEIYYNGFLCMFYETANEGLIADKVFALFKVTHFHGSALLDASDSYSEVKYLYFPMSVEQTTNPNDTNGYAEACLFYMKDASFYQGIIKAVFPDATFTLARGGKDMYIVEIVEEEILATKVYKSEISSLGWTWKP